MPFPAFVNQPGAIPCKISDTIVGHMPSRIRLLEESKT
jgi:hypothetical protein